MRVSKELYPEIRKMYEEGLLSCGAIAEKVGCTRPRIHQILRGMGVDTTKRRLPVKCKICGAEVLRPKCQIKGTLRSYCSRECYHEQVASPAYQTNRQGQRIAREVAGRLYALLVTDVVHHVDGDNSNNTPDNLVVFHSNAEHMRFHRSSIPVPAFSLAERREVLMVNEKYL